MPSETTIRAHVENLQLSIMEFFLLLARGYLRISKGRYHFCASPFGRSFFTGC